MKHIFIVEYVDGYYPNRTESVHLTREAAERGLEKAIQSSMDEWKETREDTVGDYTITEWEVQE